MKYTVTMTDDDGTTRSGSSDQLSDALTQLLLCVDECAPPHFHRLLLDEFAAFHVAIAEMDNPLRGHKLRLET